VRIFEVVDGHDYSAGSGVLGWMTEDEEDVWELELDFGGVDPEENEGLDPDMTIGELMEWRYFRAEKSKELVRVLESPTYAFDT
jgi:hypothetical protein